MPRRYFAWNDNANSFNEVTKEQYELIKKGKLEDDGWINNTFVAYWNGDLWGFDVEFGNAFGGVLKEFIKKVAEIQGGFVCDDIDPGGYRMDIGSINRTARKLSEHPQIEEADIGGELSGNTAILALGMMADHCMGNDVPLEPSDVDSLICALTDARSIVTNPNFLKDLRQ